jgi:hypothetical protein
MKADMRNVIVKISAVTATALAGFASVPATSSAEPAAHKVVYTVTAATDGSVEFNYLTAQPPSKEAYDADPYAYLKRDRLSLAPGVPWVFETTLEDTQWAYISASGATHGGKGAPFPHCEIAIDGQLAVQQDGESAATCALRPW